MKMPPFHKPNPISHKADDGCGSDGNNGTDSSSTSDTSGSDSDTSDGGTAAQDDDHDDDDRGASDDEAVEWRTKMWDGNNLFIFIAKISLKFRELVIVKFMAKNW